MSAGRGLRNYCPDCGAFKATAGAMWEHRAEEHAEPAQDARNAEQYAWQDRERLGSAVEEFGGEDGWP